MDAGSATPTANRLLLLADNTLVSVLERNRLKSLDLEPSASEEAEIQRNLQTLRDGISQLEREQSVAESDQGIPSRTLRAKEDTLIRLQMQFDKLLSLLQEGGGEQLIAKITAPKRPSLIYGNSNGQDELGSPRRNGPRKAKTVRFSDNLIDVSSATPDPLSLAAEEARNSVTNTEAMMQQQRIMREQDDSLDRLSESISRQRELSIQIGDELDQHVELLSDVDRLVDWSQHRLDGARKRLDHVSRKMKENGSVFTIVILIIILLILIIILK
ncbi:hypothetical protein BZA70DRAFT_53369 [Myxozyma melibiosi]|uniref:t-SNARE coiled-coil homology domain-containing protein n=1 Tax=Myxozyma melibiosi TaxID=54550 RepID=A0ABR1FF98_9ASCO